VQKETDRECKTHGLTAFILEGRGYYRCKKCRVECVSRKRRNLKLKAIEFLGGKCQACGYAKCAAALDFHHENEKNFDLSTGGFTRSWARILAEVKKCILLCANCHRELHDAEGANRSRKTPR
jgi:hypothetical protein